MKSDKEFLQWIYNRMVNLHDENPEVDYMRNFQAIIDRTNEDQYSGSVPTIISFEDTLGKGEIEDQGKAMILNADHPTDECFFVRLQSWDDSYRHDTLKKFENKRVRLTIKVVP